MGYSTGELARLLGMTREGVRFMEKQGIVVSQRNERNGYREFDYDQFVKLKRVRSYRSLGFSLEEARFMIDETPKGQLDALCEQKLGELEEKRRKIEEMERALRDRQRAFRAAADGERAFEIVLSPELVFFATMRNRMKLRHEELQEAERLEQLERWTQEMPVTKMFAYYDGDGVEWKGQAAKREDFEKLGIPPCAALRRFKPERCVHGALEARVFERPDFSPVKRWAQARGLTLRGTFSCVMQLTYRAEEGDRWCIHEFFAPVCA